MKLLWKQNNKAMVCVGEDGRFYQVWQLPKQVGQKVPHGTLPCQDICGNKLRRVHVTCLTCRARKVLRGELPSYYRIGVYFLTWREDRTLARLKGLLLKKLLTFAELLAN